MKVGKIRERADRVAAGLVGQDGGANENPVEPAVSDDSLLPVLVGVHLRKRSGKIRLSKRKPPCPALSPAPIPVMQTRRETCSILIALTSAWVAVERSVTSRNGLVGG